MAAILLITLYQVLDQTTHDIKISFTINRIDFVCANQRKLLENIYFLHIHMLNVQLSFEACEPCLDSSGA
jgi:hypothetical protein